MFFAFVRQFKIQITYFPFNLRGEGLVSELLLGRYSVPEPVDGDSWLAKHERGLFEEAQSLAVSFRDGHRGEQFNRTILPRCQPLVEAIGHRMAYEAASTQGVNPLLRDVYLAAVIQEDSAWYAEHGLSRIEQATMEENAITAALPHLAEFLTATDAEYFCSSPIVSEDAWSRFVDSLKTHQGLSSDSKLRTVAIPERTVLALARL